ncbi:hypothetical protein KM043_008908 [Ampulex compressa]|nr:hypothetical protein KM043_008908 [Ampulex compressa]
MEIPTARRARLKLVEVGEKEEADENKRDEDGQLGRRQGRFTLEGGPHVLGLFTEYLCMLLGFRPYVTRGIPPFFPTSRGAPNDVEDETLEAYSRDPRSEADRLDLPAERSLACFPPAIRPNGTAKVSLVPAIQAGRLAASRESSLEIDLPREGSNGVRFEEEPKSRYVTVPGSGERENRARLEREARARDWFKFKPLRGSSRSGGSRSTEKAFLVPELAVDVGLGHEALLPAPLRRDFSGEASERPRAPFGASSVIADTEKPGSSPRTVPPRCSGLRRESAKRRAALADGTEGRFARLSRISSEEIAETRTGRPAFPSLLVDRPIPSWIFQKARRKIKRRGTVLRPLLSIEFTDAPTKENNGREERVRKEDRGRRIGWIDAGLARTEGERKQDPWCCAVRSRDEETTYDKVSPRSQASPHRASSYNI